MIISQFPQREREREREREIEQLHTINLINKPNINNPFQKLKNQRIQTNNLVFE